MMPLSIETLETKNERRRNHKEESKDSKPGYKKNLKRQRIGTKG